MSLTLNGIAQGYLTDRLADILRANACDRVLADMGRREILLVGHRPDGQAWQIGLADRWLKDPYSNLMEKKGEVRDGGSLWEREGRIAVWNTVMDEDRYMTRRWIEFIAG